MQGGFCSPQTESFDLQVSPELDGSPEGPATPSHNQRRIQKKVLKKAQKAGSRLANSDDAFQFFQLDEKEELRYCIICK
jgi:hypothetical protein